MKMKKWIVALLSVGILLSGCSNEEESVSKPPPPPLEEKKDQPVPQEIYSLPDFGTTAVPLMKIVKKNGVVLSNFSANYSSSCWNNCKDDDPIMDHEAFAFDESTPGDTFHVDWSVFDPQPAEVYLLKSGGKDNQIIISREKQNVSTPFQLVITDDTIGNNYALEFSWKDHDQLIGRSQFNFGIQ